ncbi:MAG: hypothetical protein AB1742_02250, partial [bacterium]
MKRAWILTLSVAIVSGWTSAEGVETKMTTGGLKAVFSAAYELGAAETAFLEAAPLLFSENPIRKEVLEGRRAYFEARGDVKDEPGKAPGYIFYIGAVKKYPGEARAHGEACRSAHAGAVEHLRSVP